MHNHDYPEYRRLRGFQPNFNNLTTGTNRSHSASKNVFSFPDIATNCVPMSALKAADEAENANLILLTACKRNEVNICISRTDLK